MVNKSNTITLVITLSTNSAVFYKYAIRWLDVSEMGGVFVLAAGLNFSEIRAFFV